MDDDFQHQALPRIKRLVYSVGHVLNDMCAAMWFSYLLLYFESVNRFSNSLAGYMLLLGQIADAISTPIIGYESDHQDGCYGYGKRKTWHLLGTLCVGLSFPFIFMQCITCSHSADWAQFIYYAPFVVLFQFGWASTQISHLSLIPELTSDSSVRLELNAFRYAFTVLSNITVYCLTWVLLNHSDSRPTAKICPEDAGRFRNLVLTVVGIGLFFSIIFHLGTKEQPPNANRGKDAVRSPSRVCGGQRQRLTWRDWLRQYQFYLMAGLYMCTRLIVNISQIYLPMFVMHSLLLPKKYVALVPLIVYISGFVISFAMKPLNRVLKRKGTYFLGLLFVGGACVWMWFIKQHVTSQMAGAAVVLGIGTTTILVTSLSMTSDLIGDNSNSGAFVYGAMSFTDKLSNGAAVMLIQHLHPCNGGPDSCCEACVWFYRHAIVFIPGGIAGVAFIVLLFMLPVHIGEFLTSALEEQQIQEEPDEHSRLIQPPIEGHQNRALASCSDVNVHQGDTEEF